MTFKKGMAPLAVVLIVALGLIAGAAAGYEFREPLKKLIAGKSTSDEIKEAVDNELTALGQNKFELEGTTVSVDNSAKSITVKIKSSTNSIKEMRLSETPISVTDTTTIMSGDKKDLKLVDIPISAQVHVAGAISDGKLTATKVIIQKEDVDENQKEKEKHFSVGGTVKHIGSDSLVVTVATANAKAKDQKGKDLTIKISSATTIKKGDSTIAITDIKVGDDIQVTGVVDNNTYTASRIEVKIKEQAGELEQEETKNQNQGNDNSNAGGSSNNSNSKKNE